VPDAFRPPPPAPSSPARARQHARVRNRGLGLLPEALGGEGEAINTAEAPALYGVAAAQDREPDAKKKEARREGSGRACLHPAGGIWSAKDTARRRAIVRAMGADLCIGQS
jgi:hypothetical protein